MEKYTYKALHPSPNSIRLLQIHPGNEETDIQCTLFNYTIQPHRGLALYEALSYVWGDPNQKRRIHIHNTSATNNSEHCISYLDITSNLYVALHRLRDPVLIRTIWVDAVCINQEDLKERASQVRFMTQIYSHASRVIVWLGEEADDSAQALSTIGEASFQLKRSSHYLRKFLDQEGIKKPRVNQSDEETQRRSLTALLKRPWFRRVWVLQEVAAARHITIICGSSEITGSMFCNGLGPLLEDLPCDLHLRKTAASVLEMISWEIDPFSNKLQTSTQQIKQNPTFLNVLPLGELVELFHLHEASDRRDKVFALLGVSCPAAYISPPLYPDYTCSWASVFEGLIKYLLGSSVIVTTHEHHETAVILGSGYIVGTVISTQSGVILVQRYQISGPPTATCGCKLYLRADTYCKNIKAGDIVCHIQGAHYPSIIRSCIDHFDVVTISLDVKHVYLSANSDYFKISWPEFQRMMRYRELVLIWDWRPMVNQSFESHRSLLEVDPQGLTGFACRSARLEACTKILEDLRHRENLQALTSSALESLHDLKDDTRSLRYFRLLNLCCIHWESYMWIKNHVEKLRWWTWKLDNSSSQREKEADDLKTYWTDEGLLPLSIAEISELADTWSDPPIPTIERTCSPHCISQESMHSELLSKIFPSFLRTRVLHTHSVQDYSPWNGQFLIKLMLAQKNLKPWGTRGLPQIRHVEQLDSFVTEFDLKLDIIPLTILSEHFDNLLLFPTHTLEIIAQRPLAGTYFSFLLAESFRDPQTVYNILVTAIRYHVQSIMPSVPDHSSMELLPDLLSDRYTYHMVSWFHANLSVLKYYIQHTNLCELAVELEEGLVAQELLRVFSGQHPNKNAYRMGAHWVQQDLLNGINEYLDALQEKERREKYIRDGNIWIERPGTGISLGRVEMIMEDCFYTMRLYEKAAREKGTW